MQLDTRIRSLIVLIAPSVLLGFSARLIAGNSTVGLMGFGLVFIFLAGVRLTATQRLVRLFSAYEERERYAKLAPLLVKLSNRAQIQPPRVLFYADASPNLAVVGTGWRNATVLVSEGLFSAIDEEGLESLLAHALSRVRKPGFANATFAAALASLLVGTREKRFDPKYALRFFRNILRSTLAGLVVRVLVSGGDISSADEMGSSLVKNQSTYEVSLARLRALTAHVGVALDSSAIRHVYVIPPPLHEFVTDFFDCIPSIEERIARVAGRKGVSP